MPPTTPDLLSKVRKLLALATSSNVHEAASAAAKAQALIARHRLEDLLAATAVDDDPITDGREAPLEQALRPRKWKMSLATALADANDCIAYTMEVGAETHLLLIGRASDRAAVAAVWSWLVPRVEWLSATHGAGKSRRWHDAFRIGAAEAIGEQLAGVDAAAAVDLTTTLGAQRQSALVTIDAAKAARTAAVEAFAERHLSRGKARALWVDARAFDQGRAAGAALSLKAPTASRASSSSRGSGDEDD